jgi:DNA invertase Pin-like site-specific DNA recombinase
MSKKNAARRAVAYSRYSRLAGRDADALITLDQQDDTIDDVAAGAGTKIVARFSDESKSGGTLNREGFQNALAMIERGDADTIIVSRLSRFARSVPDTLATLERIHAAGGSLIAGDLNVDNRTASGRLMLTLLAAFAEFERELKREDWLVATTKALDKGVKIGRAPVGYVKQKREKLVVDDARADLVRECFELRAAKRPWREVREHWHARTNEWRAIPSLASMIRNRTYLGELHYGDRIVEDAHEPIVDLDTFERAQGDVEHRHLRGPRGEGSLLAGIVYCGSCGRRMTTGKGGAKRKSDGVQRAIYVCQRRQGKGTGTCDRPVTIGRDKLDEYVETRFLEWAGGITAETDTSDDDAKIVALDERESRLEDRRARTSAKLADLDVDESTIIDALAALDAELAATRAERDEFVAHRKVAGVRSSVRGDWPEFDVQARRRLISSGVERIVVVPATTPDGKVDRHAAIESRVSIEWRRD